MANPGIFIYVANLYPSAPLYRSIQVIVEFLQDDYAELRNKTKLNLTDIQHFLELCYFLYNNVIWTLENSGPIGLSIMVVLFECYLQRIKHTSITQALNLQPYFSTKNFQKIC